MRSVLSSPWLTTSLGAILAMSIAMVYFSSTASWTNIQFQVADVPPGDVEMAWLHTSTNGTTWERFVEGMRTVGEDALEECYVDTSRAFPAATTDIPEVVVSSTMPQHAGRSLRIRWYKLTTDWTADRWIQTLAKRSPAPLAIIGGGTSDRAKELAQAMLAQYGKDKVHSPLLFITTATATGLTEIYPHRSFRFCFSNEQMARSILDYADELNQLRETSRLALQGGTTASPTPLQVNRFCFVWNDDPYSVDLKNCFQRLADFAKPMEILNIDYSVGGTNYPNPSEQVALAQFFEACEADLATPIQVILPTVVQPARRILKAILARDPSMRDRLTVLTGDGIPVNAILRDGDVVWQYRALPCTMLLFAHAKPFESIPEELDRSVRAVSSDDVLQFAGLGRVVVQSVFGKSGEPMCNDSERLLKTLRLAKPEPFDAVGNWVSASQHLVLVQTSKDGKPTLNAVRKTQEGRWALAGRLEEQAPFLFRRSKIEP